MRLPRYCTGRGWPCVPHMADLMGKATSVPITERATRRGSQPGGGGCASSLDDRRRHEEEDEWCTRGGVSPCGGSWEGESPQRDLLPEQLHLVDQFRNKRVGTVPCGMEHVDQLARRFLAAGAVVAVLVVAVGCTPGGAIAPSAARPAVPSRQSPCRRRRHPPLRYLPPIRTMRTHTARQTPYVE